jgi:hypothetical protein
LTTFIEYINKNVDKSKGKKSVSDIRNGYLQSATPGYELQSFSTAHQVYFLYKVLDVSTYVYFLLLEGRIEAFDRFGYIS